VKIADVRAVPVHVPFRTPLITALGDLRGSDYGIVLVETDEGDRGVGEISLIWHGNGHRLCRDVNELVAPRLRGLDVFDLSRALAEMHRAFQFGRHTLTAVAAVEMALLDLQGKLLDQPVMNLFGGPVHDRIPLSMSLSIGPVDDMVAQARAFVDEGFRTVKVKSDRDVDHTVKVLAALRAEFGADLGIRTDLNMSWPTAKEALRAIRRLEAYDILSVEQPLPADDVAGMAFLRQHCEVPVMADESVWSPADAWRVVTAGAADIVNIYVSEAGGITACRRIADLCALAGVGVVVGSMPELSIGAAASTHLAFTLAGLGHPADMANFRYHASDVAVADLKVVDGFMLPPTAPGLGVQLDEDRLRHHTVEIS
jgi:L-alanine-DL-glutamate epimerase-like enolase superfamily enzyme